MRSVAVSLGKRPVGAVLGPGSAREHRGRSWLLPPRMPWSPSTPSASGVDGADGGRRRRDHDRPAVEGTPMSVGPMAMPGDPAEVCRATRGVAALAWVAGAAIARAVTAAVAIRRVARSSRGPRVLKAEGPSSVPLLVE
jgi:hypothetical protein